MYITSLESVILTCKIKREYWGEEYILHYFTDLLLQIRTDKISIVQLILKLQYLLTIENVQ